MAAVLAVLALTLHLSLARQFARAAVFDKVNVLFHADISTRLQAISGGKHLGIKHPNLMPYFTPPIMLAAKVIARVHPPSGPEAELRRQLGMLVVPIASALKTALVFVLFLRLGFSLAAAIVATLLEMTSFSTLIFGSIPESYGLTAFALALAFLLAATPGAQLTWRRIAPWMAVGVFATGVTVINIVFVAFLLWAAAWYTTPLRLAATIRVAVIVIAIFGVTGVSAYVLDWLLVPKTVSAGDDGTVESTLERRVEQPFENELGRHLQPDPVRRLRHFPTSVANAFAPCAVERVPVKAMGRGRTQLGYSLENSPSIFGLGDPLGTLVLPLLVAGAVCAFATPATRPVATASVGILAFSWVLSVWGSEAQLYSQDWQLASVVLLAGVMRPARFGTAMTVVLAVLTVVFAVNNLVILRDMLAVLAAAG